MIRKRMIRRRMIRRRMIKRMIRRNDKDFKEWVYKELIVY